MDSRPEIEVVVLARGGGDAAQLLPFSDELLCRAIACAKTPAVSAIGHEGDRPLCDGVADLRCGTPSLAAWAVVPSKAELEAGFDRLLARCAERRATGSQGPTIAWPGSNRAGRSPVGWRRPGAAASGPVPGWPSSAPIAVCTGRPTVWARSDGTSRALAPARVLERGYAVVRDADGQVVRDAAVVGVGAAVDVEVARGWFAAWVDGRG